MFRDVLATLDAWLIEQHEADRAEGTLPANRCRIHLVGQSALLELAGDLPLIATADFDVRADYTRSVEQQFEKLLNERGLVLDPDGAIAWMPKETEYEHVYPGRRVDGYVAKPVYVLLSKAKMAPEKNGPLLAAYLATGPAPEFFRLARIYQVDLERFV